MENILGSKPSLLIANMIRALLNMLTSTTVVRPAIAPIVITVNAHLTPTYCSSNATGEALFSKLKGTIPVIMAATAM